MSKNQYISIGELSRRSGVAASALRFYEQRGLVEAHRGAGNQRQFHRSALRRIAVIKVAKELGLTLEEIGAALEGLPRDRPPTRKDWQRLASRWHAQLTARIESLEMLRDNLSGCIGCGCLSLQRCALYNPEDRAAILGQGPRYIQGDSAADILVGDGQ